MNTAAGTWPFDANGSPVDGNGSPVTPEPIQHYDWRGQPTLAWLTAMRAMEAEADTERTEA